MTVATLGLHIRGWTESQSGERVEIRNPADTRKVIAVAPRATAEEARAAVKTAADGLTRSSERSEIERSDILARVADVLEGRAEQLALGITGEVGKPISEARVEAGRAVVTWAA